MAEAKAKQLSASMEDYLEAIFNLAGSSKVARSKDIAKLLGVSRASVTGALRQLKRRGLANYKPYGFITLTEEGKAAAAEVVRRHNILKFFFVNILGLDADTAQQAACRAEHTLGPEVIGRLLSFIEFVTKRGQDGCDLASEFRRFCKEESIVVKDR